METEEKYLVIGGGAAGIATGKCFRQAGLKFDIVERESDFGGNWFYGTRASKMYDSVHLISAKTNTQFSDFPMPPDYPEYPGHNLFLRYLRDVAEKMNLREDTLFNTEVKTLTPAGKKWNVQLSNGESRQYGAVIVANGLLGTPRLPQYPGEFTGEVVYANEYTGPKIFEGKRVLIVGGGNTGCDIAVDGVPFARRVVHSMRRGYYFLPKFISGKASQDWLMEIRPRFKTSEEYWEHVKGVLKLGGYVGTDFGLPEPDHEIHESHPVVNSQLLYHIGHGDIFPRPDIESLRDKRVIFTDGGEEEVDLIVYALGYRPNMPFLDKEYVDWSLGLSSLFMNCLPANFDNLLFIGYLSAPSGFGNLANTMGRFMTAYLKARRDNNQAYRVLSRLKTRWDEIDMGQEGYMKTERHGNEVDLWKYVQAMNFMRAKLEGAD